MGLRNRTKLKDYNCFFITTTCYNHISLLNNEVRMEMIYESIRFVNKKYSCQIVAYVWMPNHIHFICYFEKENFLIEYMRDFKKYTSFRIRKSFSENPEERDIFERLKYNYRQQKFKVWTDRFDDLYLFNPKTLLVKLNYIHNNPVKKGLSPDPWSYKHSSAAYYLNDAARLLPNLNYK